MPKSKAAAPAPAPAAAAAAAAVTITTITQYKYDDCGVKCRINPQDENDFQPCEPYCFPCGARTEECVC